MSTKKRQIRITLTGPPGMVESMAKVLRDEGYTVLPPGSADKAVLDASAAIPRGVLNQFVTGAVGTPWKRLTLFATAELVRRKAKP